MLTLRPWLLKVKGKTLLCRNILTSAVSTFLKIVLFGVSEEEGNSTARFSFSPEEKPKRKPPVYRLAARETKTKCQVKDEVILNSQSNPVDNLAELESVNIPFQEDGLPGVITD